MAMIEAVLLTLSFSLAVAGIGIYLLTFAAPRLLEGRFMRWFVTGPRLEPTLSNQRLMAVWALICGAMLSLIGLRFPWLAFATLVLFLPVTYLVISRARRSDGPNSSLKRTNQSLRD